MPNAKEITQWNFNGICILIIPARPQNDPSQVVVLLAGMGAPDVIDATGSDNIGQCCHLAGLDNQKIHVAPGAIPTGDTTGRYIADSCKFP